MGLRVRFQFPVGRIFHRAAGRPKWTGRTNGAARSRFDDASVRVIVGRRAMPTPGDCDFSNRAPRSTSMAPIGGSDVGGPNNRGNRNCRCFHSAVARWRKRAPRFAIDAEVIAAAALLSAVLVVGLLNGGRLRADRRRVQHRRLRPQGARLVHERLQGPVPLRDRRIFAVVLRAVVSHAHGLSPVV